MAARIFRINYKSDFILTMQSDAGWEIPFCIKFWTGAPSIAYFAGWDGTTYIHCALDGEDPTKLHVQFDDHHLPIGDLKFQIGYHFTVEDFPNNTEDEVINQAAVIIDQDGTQMQVMLDLNGETAPEIEFNLPAYANEAQRIANEEQRISNEAQRIANEEQRIANEEQRISNEEQRIAAESIRIANEESRISEFAQLKHDAEIATADANAAATLANEKAALAAEKAALSHAAAELANAKATLAQQKADYAQTQGDYARAQGDYAKEQGNIAEADHERAESDHTRAENDHTAVEVYVDSLGAFDISAYHATGGVLAKYVDLSAALDGGNNIPEAIRKGGMSVKFVQSSDNKYVQYRLMADVFSTNLNEWAFCGNDVYTENPEFVRVVTDTEGRILYGVKADGEFVFGVGVPQSIKDYVLSQKAEVDADVLAEKTRAMAAESSLNTAIGSETTRATTAENALNTAISNEVARATAVEATKANSVDVATELATKVDKEEGKSLIDAEYASSQSAMDNPEYLQVTTDSEDKVLAGRTTDGAAFENIGFSTPKVSIDDATMENIEDPEDRTEIKTDGEGKIISYRDSEGVIHENVGIKSPTASIDTINTRQVNIIGLPDVTMETSIYLEKPKFAEFRFYGTLPTDQSLTRTPTTLNFLYKVNGQILLSAKCTLAIQGHGSANYPKKGYTFEPINVDGDAIDIKWGDMIAVDSFHMKAYYSDRTHSRGIGGAKVWRQMIDKLPYPYNKVNNKALNIAKGQKVDAYCIADAKYSEDGFPFAFYLNDEFYGLYTLKLKKNRKNYAMEKSNKNEIFLDCLGYDVSVGHSGKLDDPFDAGAWDLKNPKLSGYEEGGEITDAGVLANIERLFTFTNNITTMYNQHEDYIVLPHWLCWYIHCELIGDVDKNGNNLELATWDGTHWSILPYDMDVTAGVYGGGSIQVTKSGYVLNPTFYQNFRTVFETEIKTLYSALRKSGCIEINNLYRTYLGQIEAIPRDIYNKEAKKWPNGIWNNNEWPVIEQLYSYLNSRIEYLDSVWLLND